MTQDPKSREIRHSQRMALVAARRIKNDVELEANITEAQVRGVPQTSLINPRDSSPAGVFRNQYLQLINSEEDCQNLERELNQLNLLATEWSYSVASGFKRFLPTENDFGGGDDQYRNSTAVVPALIEMLGSLPSVNSGEGILPQRRASEQSGEQDASVQSQRRPSELSNEQVMPGQRRTSVFSYEQNFIAQRRTSELSSEWSDLAQRTPSTVSTEQNDNAQRRASEFSSYKVIAARTRPSGFSMEQTTTPQTEVQRRASELSNAQSVTSQMITSELAGDENAMAQRRSEPRGSQSFNIYGE
jgi:hypothetical protein